MYRDPFAPSRAHRTSSGRNRRARVAHQRDCASLGDRSGFQGIDITDT
jgi:hypothetical protein